MNPNSPMYISAFAIYDIWQASCPKPHWQLNLSQQYQLSWKKQATQFLPLREKF
jgi:hypothetical protein